MIKTKSGKIIASFLIFLGLTFLCCSAILYAAQSGKSIKDSLSKADRYYKSGKYQNAITLWETVLADEPDNAKARQGIEAATEKIAKVRDFFGGEAFKQLSGTNEFSLEDCLRVSAENSIPLESARAQIRSAQVKVWEARRGFFPALSVSWTKTSGIQSGGKVEGLEYGVEGKQPAFRSGSIMYTLAQARASVTIAESNYDKVGNELYFEVAKAYYILVRAKKQWEYTQEIFEDMKPFYEMAKKAYEKTVTPTIEFLNVESNFNQIYYQTISDANEYELSKLNLEQKLSVEDAGNMDITVVEEARTVNKDIKTCLELALENRPDLRSGLYTVKYAEYGKKIADAKEMPAVDFIGHFKKAAEVYREDFSAFGTNEPQSLDPHDKWYFGLEASVPFMGSTASYTYFRRHDPPSLSTYEPDSESRGTTVKVDVLNNMKNLSEIEEARAANVKAEQDLEDARKKVIMEVKEAFYGYEKARIQLEAAKAQKAFREKEVKILKFKSSMGEDELSGIFDSAIKLLEANTLYCEAEASLNISIVALNRAIGIESYF